MGKAATTATLWPEQAGLAVVCCTRGGRVGRPEGTPVRLAPITSDRQKELWGSGRFLHALIATGQGRCVMNTMVFHRVSGATGDAGK